VLRRSSLSLCGSNPHIWDFTPGFMDSLLKLSGPDNLRFPAIFGGKEVGVG
jgi:hypothetical protein